MIIACPKCTGPYQLADDQVAPLVQVQCPHCEYRVILDFAAANDPSLREPEMLLADGFRSADDYQQALADGHQVASYDLPAPPPTPVITRPTAPTTPPVSARSTSTPASRPQPTPVLETPAPSSLLSGSALSDKPGSLGAAVQDFSRPDPEPEPAELKPAEPVAEVKPVMSEKPAEPVAEVKPEKPAEPVAEVKPEKPAEPTQPEARTPPHTPPVTPTAKEPPTPELRPGKPIEPAAESGKRPIEKAPEKPAERPVEKAPEKQAEAEGGRGPGLILLIFLIIIAAVFAVTYLKTGSFDPRLLLSPPAPPPT